MRPVPETHHHNRQGRRRVWLISLGIALFVLLAAALWLGTRVLVARDGLESAAETASTIPDLVQSGDAAGAVSAARDFETDADAARAATSDPVWRVAEWLPWLGSDLTAVRGMSEVAADLASAAVLPLAETLGRIDISSLGFADGRIDVAPLAGASPDLAAANTALQHAVERVNALPEPTLPIVAGALERLQDATAEAAAVIDGLDRAAAVLPAMIGTDGPRTYLLLVLNNAEARSLGGIAGAGAVLRFDDGRITIERQFSSRDFERAEEPVIDLSPGTISLFEDLPGRFIQNTASSLDFTETASAAAALWEHTSGQRVDGVIAIDAVSISYLLKATGPVQAGPFSLSAANAVDTLLSTAYAQILDTTMQDEAFALVARAVFEALAAGEADPSILLGALGRSMDEQRLHVWSSHAEEQARIDGTPLATMLPPDSDTTRIGIFANDVTGAKLDYYATPSTLVELDSCTDAPRVTVTVDWTNTIPADAASTLPKYVLGPELMVPTFGDTLTRIAVAGPDDWLATDYSIDGEQGGVQAAQYGNRTVLQHEFVTTPGGSHRIVVKFTAPEGTTLEDLPIKVVSTPLVHANEVEIAHAKCTD